MKPFLRMSLLMKSLTQVQTEKILADQMFQLPYFRAMLRAVEQSFYMRMELAEPILDIGAGDGQFAQVTFSNLTLIGIDPWWQPLTEAGARKVYRLLTQAAGDALPFTDASFPTAISNSVLEHIPEVQPVLDEVARKLEVGGKFIITVPNQRFITDLWGVEVFKRLGLRGMSKRYSQFFNRIARHHNLNTPEVWTERLKQAGFSQVEHFNYFPRWALHKLERGHLWGLPNLFWKKVFGKWILFPYHKNPFIPYEMVERLLADPISEDGTCTCLIATR